VERRRQRQMCIRDRYRSEEDATQNYKKVRKSLEDLFVTI
jgi:hypothetical protein